MKQAYIFYMKPNKNIFVQKTQRHIPSNIYIHLLTTSSSLSGEVFPMQAVAMVVCAGFSNLFLMNLLPTFSLLLPLISTGEL